MDGDSDNYGAGSYSSSDDGSGSASSYSLYRADTEEQEEITRKDWNSTDATASISSVTSSVPKKGGGSAEEYKLADSRCICQIRDCDEFWSAPCERGSCQLCFCDQHLQVHLNRCAGLSSKYP